MRARNVLAACLTMTFLVAAAGTARAEGTMHGDLDFVVTCNFQAFPAYSWTSAGCSGEGTGEVSGQTQISGAVSYTFICAACPVGIQMETLDTCITNTVHFPPTGSWRGLIVVRGLVILVGTQPGVFNATLTIPFIVTRVGFTLFMLDGRLSGLGNKVLTLDATGGVIATDLLGSTGSGVMDITTAHGTCSAPAPLMAIVALHDKEIF